MLLPLCLKENQAFLLLKLILCFETEVQFGSGICPLPFLNHLYPNFSRALWEESFSWHMVSRGFYSYLVTRCAVLPPPCADAGDVPVERDLRPSANGWWREVMDKR